MPKYNPRADTANKADFGCLGWIEKVSSAPDFTKDFDRYRFGVFVAIHARFGDRPH